MRRANESPNCLSFGTKDLGVRAEIQEAHITGLRRVRVDIVRVTLLGQVMMRDLGQSPPPHMGQAFITGMYAAPEQRTPEQAKAIACPMLIDELFAVGAAADQPQTVGD